MAVWPLAHCMAQSPQAPPPAGHHPQRSTHVFTPTALLEQLKTMNKPDEEPAS